VKPLPYVTYPPGVPTPITNDPGVAIRLAGTAAVTCVALT